MPTSLLDAAFAKPAPADFPLHDLLRQRWSPRAFSADDLTPQELNLLFEAARWSPSAFNEQPWRFIVATRPDKAGFGTLLSCMNPGNQLWAAQAAALVITVARRDLASKPQPNRTAQYDLGQAVAHLTFQATALGIAVHQMAGFDLDQARALCEIPQGYDPVSAVALGRPADSATLPEPARQKDAAVRVRKPLAETVFGGAWDQPARW
jgi:nitroreductase